jgi:putative ABC transport system substrate-binding protein
VEIDVLRASTERDIDEAFARLAQKRVSALAINPDSLFSGGIEQLVALTVRYAMPTIYNREFAVAGGLIGYGVNLADVYRMVGVHTGRVLAGAKPADLPVQQSTRVELVINLKTAKTLGITFPTSLLVRADEVIE